MLFDVLGVLAGMTAVVAGYRFAPLLFKALIVVIDETEFSRRDRLDIEERFRQVIAEYELS